jgi:hypothetical protein
MQALGLRRRPLNQHRVYNGTRVLALRAARKAREVWGRSAEEEAAWQTVTGLIGIFAVACIVVAAVATWQ